MRRRMFAIGAAIGIAVAMTPVAAADASTSNPLPSVPALCVHQPLPLFPGAQLEVGYCPNG